VSYIFYCNRADTGVGITTPYNLRIDQSSSRIWSALDLCDYSSPGVYTPKVIIESRGIAAEGRTNVTVAKGTAGSAPPTLPTVIITKNLAFGIRDPEVQKLQEFLKKIGLFPISEETTTFFGKITLGAVIEYQKRNKIEPALGFVGPLTRAHMAGSSAPLPLRSVKFPRNLYRGISGDDVKLLQEMLQRLGFFPQTQSATGYFGAITEEAVRKFQCSRMGICSGSPEENGYGLVGPRTRAELEK